MEILIYCAFLFFSGFSVLRIIGEFSFWEEIVYGIGIGFSIVSLVMCLSSFIFNNFFFGYIFILLLSAIGSFLWIEKNVKKIKKSEKKVDFVIIILLFIIYMVYSKNPFFKLPLVVWDSWASYGLKGKIFFIEQKIPFEIFKNTQFLSFLRIPFYPLNLALNEAFIATLLNNFDEIRIKMICFLFGLLNILLIYISVREYSKCSFFAFIFGFIFAMIPFSILHSVGYFAGISDIIFTFYNFASALFLYNFYLKGDKKYFFLSSLFLPFSIWTKFEGLISLIVLSMGMFLFFSLKELKKILFFYVLPSLSIIFVGILFKTITKTEFNYSLLRKGIFEDFFIKLSLFLKFSGKELFLLHKWGIFWIVFIVFLLVNIFKLKDKEYLYFFGVMSAEFIFSLFVLALLWDKLNIIERIKTGPPLPVERELLHILPLGIILISLNFCNFSKTKIDLKEL